jgi:hypothetical protein
VMERLRPSTLAPRRAPAAPTGTAEGATGRQPRPEAGLARP